MKLQKRIILTLFLVGFLVSCSENQNIALEELQQIKENVIKDSRLEIFEITQNGDSIIVKTNNKEVQEKIDALNNNNVYTTLLPQNSLKTFYGVINLSVANMRSKTRHGSTLITQGILGTPVRIFEKRGSWYRIQTPDKYMGWVDDYGVWPMTAEKFRVWAESEKIIFTDYTGFVYAEKNCTDNVISDIVIGNTLKHIQTGKDYYQVEFPDKRSGYVRKSQAKIYSDWLASRELSGESLVNLSKKFMGIPYLWGGTSIKGLDCSGFVKMLYFMHGKILQRDASQQVLYGREISTENNYKNLQKGDLMFFGKANRITHVGMYIGNLEYIHEAGRVKINSLDEKAKNYNSFRASSLQKVKRIIGSKDTAGISDLHNNEFYK